MADDKTCKAVRFIGPRSSLLIEEVPGRAYVRVSIENDNGTRIDFEMSEDQWGDLRGYEFTPDFRVPPTEIEPPPIPPREIDMLPDPVPRRTFAPDEETEVVL